MVSKFTAVLFVFAAILLYSAYKLLKDDDENFDPGTSLAVRLLRKIMPSVRNTQEPSSSSRKPESASQHHCSPSSSPSKLPTSCSQSTVSRQCWQ